MVRDEMLIKHKKIWLLLIILLGVLCIYSVNRRGQNKHQEQEELRGIHPVDAPVFKNGETTAKENRLENDYIRIWSIPEDYEWMQENADGTGKKPLDIEFDEIEEFNILWLDNDWLYYYTNDGLDNAVIGRIPFQYDKHPVFDEKNKEILVEASSSVYVSDSACLVTDSYLLYIDDEEDDSGNNVVYQYDLRSKQNTVLYENAYFEIMVDEVTQMPLTMDNTFFLRQDVPNRESFFFWREAPRSNNIYRVSFDTLEKVKIYSEDDYVKKPIFYPTGTYEFFVPYSAVSNNTNLYFLAPYHGDDDQEDYAIMEYDGQRGKVSCVLDNDSLKKAIKNLRFLNGVEDDWSCAIEAIYMRYDRMYIHVSAWWSSVKPAVAELHKGDTEKIEHYRDAWLWSELQDLNHWTEEEKLQDYVIQNSIPYVYNKDYDKYFNGNYTYEEDAYVNYITMHMDKVIFAIPKNIDVETNGFDADKLTYMTYDIQTGEFEEIPEDDYRLGWLDM